MALTQKLEIRQSHALVMTPQLMQAIKLLQLSNLDLATYVETELERNPLLERTADRERDGEAPAATGAAPAEAGAADWRGDGPDHQRAPAEAPPRISAKHPSTTASRRPTPPLRARPPRCRPAIRNGPAPAPAVARTATTTSRLSSRSRPRSPTISPSSSCWRSAIRPAV